MPLEPPYFYFMYKYFDQMPVPHGVMAVAVDDPSFTQIEALFRKQEDAENFVAIKNERTPDDIRGITG